MQAKRTVMMWNGLKAFVAEWKGCVLSSILILLAMNAFAQEAMPPEASFPFVMPFEETAGCVVDVSGWLDAPAGEDGFVRVRDGHFHQGGERIRFWGTNLAFGGAFPNKQDAAILADRFARFGVNIVRIHSADVVDGRPSLIDGGRPDTQHLDAENLDRLDFLVAELKKRGIYTNFNLHVNRTFKEGDGVADADSLPTFSKNVTLFDERMIELQEKYASDLLGHRNPYTGNVYANEPALAFVEISNENSFFYGWYSKKLDNLPPSYAEQLDTLFIEWLQARYDTTEELVSAWRQPLPDGESLEEGRVSRPAHGDESRSQEAVKEYLNFLWKIEERYYRRMRDFLKETVKVQMPVTGTMYFTLAGGMIQGELMDFVDMHAYWQHPEFPAAWKGKWTIKNTPMTDQPSTNTLTWLGASRIDGKPFTVSEFNEPWPNFYEAEALPLIAAYAARQDWDGVYIFNYNGNGEFRRDHVYSWFDIDGHPVKTAQMIAGSAIFARGDVAPAARRKTATVSRGTALDSAREHGWNRGERALKALGWEDTNTVDLRWGLKFLPYEMASVARLGSITGAEAAAPMEWTSGLATLNTERSKFVVGHPTGRPIYLGHVAVEILPSATNFAAITLTSLDGLPISKSESVLLIAAGRTQNTDMKWDSDFRSAYEGSGVAPVLTEGIAARLSFPIEPGQILSVHALNEGGALGEEVPLMEEAPAAMFEIGPGYRTIWYLIRREEGQ